MTTAKNYQIMWHRWNKSKSISVGSCQVNAYDYDNGHFGTTAKIWDTSAIGTKHMVPKCLCLDNW